MPGDLDHPGAFLSIRLSRGEGALLITQGEWAFAPGAQAVIGAWGYTARTDAVDPADRPAHQSGVYGFVQGPIPQVHGLTGWIRAGVADPDVQAISGYLGAGLVATGPLPARPHDNLGLAVAIAQLGDPTRRLGDLPAREIAWEATYSAPLTDWLTLQPDLQYIQHPAGAPGLDDALVVGLRIIVSLTQPVG